MPIGDTDRRSDAIWYKEGDQAFTGERASPYGSAGNLIVSVLTGVAAGSPGIEGRAGVASPGIVGRATLADGLGETSSGRGGPPSG
jgi:hypothetical protein